MSCKESADASVCTEPPAESGPKERVTDKVNKEIMTQLTEMGFPEVRAEKGLWLTGTPCCCFCVFFMLVLDPLVARR